MGIWLKRSKRKPSGGRFHYSEPKKKMHIGNVPTLTSIGEPRVRNVKSLGSKIKLRALSLSKVNVYDPKKKKVLIADIEDVVNNPANRHYIRMDVLGKGAILKTNLGYVRVTNRPSQEGVVNGVITDFTESKVEVRESKKAEERTMKKHKDRKEVPAPKEEKKKEEKKQ